MKNSRKRLAAVEAAGDPHVPIIEVTTMKAEVQNSLWQERLVLVMTGFFAFSGLLLAGVGLYGALSQAVGQRTRDVGIRLALGARVGHIVEAVCLRQFVVVLIGAAAGLGLSAFVLKVTQSVLYGISASDPLSECFALAIVLIAAMLAAVAPTVHASRIDPSVVLRCE